MHRRDYEIIAKALAFDEHDNDDGCRFVRNTIVERMADALEADNPRFSRKTFLAACKHNPFPTNPFAERLDAILQEEVDRAIAKRGEHS